MNSKFNCWLIANLETFAGICFITLLFLQNSDSGINQAIPEVKANTQNSTWYLIIIGLALVVSIFFSVIIAIYTYRNFDEVVSRRMLWRNSNVSLFNEQLKYTLSRFGNALIFSVLFFIDIAILVFK